MKPGPGDSLEMLARLRQQVFDAVGDGVLVCPLLLTRPLRHGATWLPLAQIPMAVPFNMTGLPVVVVPAYWTANGLPLAVQVVAGKARDELALAAAMALEERSGRLASGRVKQFPQKATRINSAGLRSNIP